MQEHIWFKGICAINGEPEVCGEFEMAALTPNRVIHIRKVGDRIEHLLQAGQGETVRFRWSAANG